MRIPRISALLVLCTALILVSAAGVFAAAGDPDVDWQATFGDPGDAFEWAGSVVQTADGGYILAGGVGGGFGSPDTDAWLIKTDAAGNRQWSRTFDWGGWDVAGDAVQAADGGYALIVNSSVMVGWVWTYECRLVKTDASGNVQWSRSFGGGEFDRFDHVLRAADGGYVIGGSLATVGDPDGDVWLLKTDASGNQVWSRSFDVGSGDSTDALIRTADGGYVLAGSTTGTGGLPDGWLLKADAGGNRTWAKIYPGRSAGWDAFASVEQTADGGYIAAGDSESAAGGFDAWLLKTDASGAQQWSRFYDAAGVWASAHSAFEVPGGYLVAGAIGPSLGGSDLWLFTVDATGNPLWEKQYGGGSPVNVNDGVRTSDGGYVLAGDVSSDPQAMVGNSAWLAKIHGATPSTTTSSSTTSTTVPPSTTTTTQPPNPGGSSFPDVPASHPYHDAIIGMADAGVINGYPDLTFGPDRRVWRQHFAKMIVGTLGFPCSEADVCGYWDVDIGGPTTLYPDNYIAVAAAFGITKGIGGGRFGPYNDITRAQVITMVVRAAEDYTNGLEDPDAAYYGGWGLFRGFQDQTHGRNAHLAEFNGLLTGIKGSGDPSVWIWQPATRGEVAQILWNLSQMPGVAG